MRISLQKTILLFLVTCILYVVVGYSVEACNVQRVNNAVSNLRMLGRAIQDYRKRSGSYPHSDSIDGLCKEIAFDSSKLHSFASPQFCEVIYLKPQDCSMDCEVAKCATKNLMRFFSLKRYYIEMTLFSDATVTTNIVYVN